VGKHMERQVSDDVLHALKLFTHDFGPGPPMHLAVSEIMEFHGEAFSGFLHMGLPTWVATDLWGSQRLFRAHEVAHQWWGTDVGYETYHDQWLSEGLAEYSALLYVQATEGNDRFLKMLRDYRDEIFSADKLGPVALGVRNSTNDLPDGYDLAVYKKGAYVMHMLRNLFLDLGDLGDQRFFDLLREYYRTYRDADATTHDFEVLAEKYAGADLGWFFDQWVYGTELPTYDFDYDIVKKTDGSFAAQCTVKVEHVSPDFKMFVPVEVEMKEGQKAYLRYLIEGTGRQFEIADLPLRPKKLLFNPFESVLARVTQ
jgi:aminopeptidase N